MAAPLFKFATYDLNSCIELSNVLWGRGGGTASADELAVWLGYSQAKNGAFLTRLANARLFGLVEGPSSALKTTRRALSIIKPDQPATEAAARMEAFESVPLFKAVLVHYHGDALPDEAGMRNALETRWEITADKSASVYARMMDSAEQAGLFRTSGNRSRMIRPTSAATITLPAPDDAGSGDPPPPPPPPPLLPPPPLSGVRGHKLVDGALDLLPNADDGWNEEELAQWLRFVESALRVVYRLPKGATVQQDVGRLTAEPSG